MIASLKRAVRHLDSAVGRTLGRRVVVVDARTPMNFSILAPVAARLQQDPDIEVVFTADHPGGMSRALSAAGVAFEVHPRNAMKWRRVDLCISADPWDPIDLRRCSRRANFFHGVAGKYDLDSPDRLPAGFADFDRVAFVNVDRLRRYLAAGVVKPESAVLVGYPKVDALVNGCFDAGAIRARLRLDPHRRTAIYAPTWSPAASLHVAGERIVTSLVDAGLNVIVKLHDRSLDPTNEKFSGGVDWRARFARMEAPDRIAFVETGDSSPLLAASDLMVTDHSSVGFEFYLLDRPMVIFDTPDLIRVARINPEKVALLRSAARVVRTTYELGTAVLEEIEHPDRRSAARCAIAREMFYEPGTATTRAVDMLYELLHLPTQHPRDVSMRERIPASLP